MPLAFRAGIRQKNRSLLGFLSHRASSTAIMLGVFLISTTLGIFSLSVPLGVILMSVPLNGQEKQVMGSETQRQADTAVFGGGCFWCVEAIFQRLKGVEKVESGYAGGALVDPTYEAVSAGKSGHAEVVRITFDPKLLSYEKLLTVFFYTHDPTTLNQQGADIGTQYRSVVFYNSEAQKASALAVMKEISEEKIWHAPLVTEVEALPTFYTAEEYHQNYYNRNTQQGYCSIVIAPKIKKLYEKFPELVVPK